MVTFEGFFGAVQNEYLRALLMLVISFAFAQLIYYLFKNTLAEIAKRTKTKVDDLIVEVINLPIYYIIIFGGIYLALKSLSIISGYNGALDKIFLVLIIILIAVILARVTDVFVNSWLKSKNKKTPKLVNKIVNLTIYLIAILMILQFFEVKITPLLATLGLGALAVGLALQPTLANMFAGVRLLSDRPIEVGDYIELDDKIAGYVEDIGWNTTRIRTLINNIIIVPNSKLADSIIINNSLPQSDLGVIVKCGVDYSSDLKKVGDSNINFFVFLRAETHLDKYMVTHEFIKELKERYDKEKIEISWPIRKVYSSKK